jgi:hypothetical protein
VYDSIRFLSGKGHRPVDPTLPNNTIAFTPEICY